MHEIAWVIVAVALVFIIAGLALELEDRKKVKQ